MSVIYEASFPNLSICHSLDLHPQKNDFPMHVHNHNEIFVFVSGHASYLVEGSEYPLSMGSLLTIRESESHAINFLSDEPYERFVINFSPSVISDIDPERKLLTPFYDRELGVGNLYETGDLPNTSALSYLKAMCSQSSDPYEKRIALVSHLLPLLHDISRAFKSKSSVTDEQALLSVRIISYVNDHLFEPITTPDVAKHFYMSVSQLERIFKRATHSSVWHYVTVKRLAAARAKIESGYSSTAACAECGFGDYSAFYRAYVKEYGAPPNAHRRAFD